MNARQGIPLVADPDALAESSITTLVRSVLAIANGKLNPNVVTKDYLRKRWGDDAVDDVAWLMRAATAPAMTTQIGWASVFARTTPAFVSALVPVSAGADLLSRVLGLSFDGAAVIKIPTVTLPLADFVAQGAPIPVVTAITESGPEIAPFKFAVITTLSRETVESSNAELLVRQAMLDNTGPALDARLFDNNPGVPELRPPGLLYGKTALTPTTGIAGDLTALAAAVAPVAGNGGIGFIASATQATAIDLGLPKDFPYWLGRSTSLPPGRVIAVALNAVATAMGDAPLIDVSKAATLQMSDQPSELSATGSAVMTGPTIVTFQNDVIALRLRWPISWCARDPRGVAFMDVSW
jgi:hypothetical protein